MQSECQTLQPQQNGDHASQAGCLTDVMEQQIDRLHSSESSRIQAWQDRLDGPEGVAQGINPAPGAIDTHAPSQPRWGVLPPDPFFQASLEFHMNNHQRSIYSHEKFSLLTLQTGLPVPGVDQDTDARCIRGRHELA